MFKKEWENYKTEMKEAFLDLRTKGKRKKQIPNILTSLRLLAPLFILPASFLGNIPFVLVSIITFSVTDMLDGFIARKFHLTSPLGRDLDAFSDKVFAGTLLLAASILNPILLLTFSLEACIAGINVNAKLRGIEAKSLLIGKVKTFFLFPLLGCSLISFQLSLEMLFHLLFAITTVLQLITVSSYHRNYRNLIVKEKSLKEMDEDTSTTVIMTDDKQKETRKKTSVDLVPFQNIRKSLVEEENIIPKPFYKI